MKAEFVTPRTLNPVAMKQLQLERAAFNGNITETERLQKELNAMLN